MTKKKKELLTGCALCGAQVALQSGFKRCTNLSCQHVQNQSYAFAPCEERKPVPKFHNPERQSVRPIDEEFQ